MTRKLSLVLAAALCLSLVPAAFAENPAGVRQGERIAANIEDLYQQLLGTQNPNAEYFENADGVYGVSVPLPEELLGRLVDSEDGVEAQLAKSLTAISAGLQLSEPSRASSLIHTALSDQRFDYNYWWVVLNTTGQDLIAGTSYKLTGPGNKFNRSSDLTYRANSVTLYYYNPGFGVDRAGVYTLKVKVTGGGAAKTKTVAE